MRKELSNRLRRVTVGKISRKQELEEDNWNSWTKYKRKINRRKK
jgi:hypothetical protein